MGKETHLHATARLTQPPALPSGPQAGDLTGQPSGDLSGDLSHGLPGRRHGPQALPGWARVCAVTAGAWLLSGAVLGTAWAQNTKAAAGPAATSAANVNAAALPAAPPRTPARPTVGCLIGPEAVADIGTAVTGVVALVAVDRGDAVRAGQVLVQLQNEVEQNNFEAARSRATLEADIHAAESTLALAQQRHVRASGLVKEGFASPQTLEQALAERDVAEQKLLQARAQKTINAHELGLVKAQLNQRTLKSPFNGVVVERYVSPGERAEDKPLLRVAMLDPLRVELVMPAARWGSVAPGDEVALVPELPQAATVVGRVSHIDKMIDAASNTFRVRLSLPNPGNRLPAGARCRVEGAAGLPGAAGPSALTGTTPGGTVVPAANTRPRAPAGALAQPRT